MPEFDYVVCGAGLFSAVFSRQMIDAGKTVLIVEQRDYIGGNCATKQIEGVTTHLHGPHIFHCQSSKIWNWVNQFATFNNFKFKVKAISQGRPYSFPPNLTLFHELYGCQTPDQARKKISELTKGYKNEGDLESFVLSSVGKDVFERFYKSYSERQWGVPCKEIPVSVGARIPVRFNWNDSYFTDTYEGIPLGGYSTMFDRILDGIPVELGVDFMENFYKYWKMAKRIIYTGEIDRFFEYTHGKLGYRSLRFDHQVKNTEDFQGIAVINQGDASVPFSRITEHRHFEQTNSKKTVISYEYPEKHKKGMIPYYPINNEENKLILKKYQHLASHNDKMTFHGRLGSFAYLDMWQVINSALNLSEKELGANAP